MWDDPWLPNKSLLVEVIGESSRTNLGEGRHCRACEIIQDHKWDILDKRTLQCMKDFFKQLSELYGGDNEILVEGTKDLPFKKAWNIVRDKTDKPQ